MTVVYKLTDSTTTVDLTTGGNTVRLVNSYSYSGRDGDRVTEVFDIKATGSSESDLRDNAQELADLLMAARAWVADTLRDTPTYLVWNTTGETEKRALIYDFELEPAERAGVSPHDLQFDVGFWRMAVTRSYAWEASSATQVTNNNSIDTLGGDWTPSGVAGGDFDARLASLLLTAAAGSGDQTEVWVGIRPARPNVDNSSWSPLLECETSFTAISGDAAAAADANASDGDAVEIDFSSETAMAFRFYRTVDTNTLGQATLRGRYHILMRAKITAGTAAVRVAASLTTPSTTTPHTRGPIVYVDDTSYTLFDMGTFSLPFSLAREGIANTFTTQYLSVMAEQVDGSGTLSCDAFVLIPADYSVYLENVEELGDGNRLDLRTTEDGQLVALVEDGSNNALAAPSAADTGAFPWAFPREGGRIVVASQQSSGHDLTDGYGSQQVNVHYRWLAYHT